MSAVASGALQRAASMWFLTAVAGQWLSSDRRAAIPVPMTACLVVLTVVMGIGQIHTVFRNWAPLLAL